MSDAGAGFGRWLRTLWGAGAEGETIRFQQIFEAMHEGFALCELVRDEAGGAIDFRVLEANPAFATLTGVPLETARGALASVLAPEAEAIWLATYVSVVDSGEPATFEARAAALARWFQVHAFPVEADQFGVFFLDVTARKEAEAHEQLVIAELNHRVKNTLATVQSIAANTLRSAPDLAAFGQRFEARLLALAKAHNLLTQTGWSGAGLHAVLDNELAPYARLEGEHALPRVRLAGPVVTLASRQALPLELVLHELVTNAAKYGALSTAAGTLDVGWSADRADAGGRWLDLVWCEAGGPSVTPPDREGFGSRLIRRTVEGELAGVLDLDFAEAGLVCRLSVPLDEGVAGAASAAS